MSIAFRYSGVQISAPHSAPSLFNDFSFFRKTCFGLWPVYITQTMAQYLESEARDAVRYSWNAWPSTRVEAGKFVVPLSTMYTPLKPLENLAQVPYEPIHCKGQQCNCVLNPYWCETKI